MHSSNPYRFKSMISFFFSTYMLMVILCATYLPFFSLTDFRTGYFSLSMILTYGAVYLLPAAALSFAGHALLARWGGVGRGISYGLAVLSTGISLIILCADRMIYRLFHFHLNGFVWNLLTTKGGVESMGGSASTSVSYGVFIMAVFALQTLLLYFFLRLEPKQTNLNPYSRYKYQLIVVFILLATSQAMLYGLSSFQGFLPVTNTATALPLYQPLTIKGVAGKLGFKPATSAKIKLKQGQGALQYPLEPLELTPPKSPLNIVWLVAESWRYDMLTPEIMPEMSNFAAKASNFRQHYSGGNGTRMGLFSQFYGLYGSYWFQFLNEQRSPVLMDVLQQQQYQLSLYTSAAFSYPEFDKTLFASVAKKDLHSGASGAYWQRDRQNVGQMLDFIKTRDRKRPFMTFMFFESPHARYYFPKENIIRPTYLKDFNYATMSLKNDMELIRNRYINSCNHLDSQLGRITSYLEKENLLANTMVIITGDHGEEFMENSNWGHNSEFTEQQVRVPLLLWLPGEKPQKIERMTSHLDIPATILPRLGVQSPAETYSLGHDLLSSERQHTIVSDWARIAYIDKDVKAVFPVSNRSINKSYFTTKNDAPLEAETFWLDRRQIMVTVLENLRAFMQTDRL